MIDAVELTVVNHKCDPPYFHDNECLCEEKEAEEADDYREAMLDRWEGYR